MKLWLHLCDILGNSWHADSYYIHPHKYIVHFMTQTKIRKETEIPLHVISTVTCRRHQFSVIYAGRRFLNWGEAWSLACTSDARWSWFQAKSKICFCEKCRPGSLQKSAEIAYGVSLGEKNHALNLYQKVEKPLLITPPVIAPPTHPNM